MEDKKNIISFALYVNSFSDAIIRQYRVLACVCCSLESEEMRQKIF